MVMKFSVIGLNALRARIARAPIEGTKASIDAVKASAEAIEDYVRANVRQNTGRLAETIETQFTLGGLGASVGWRDPASFYSKFHEFGTYKMSANPVLQPSADIESMRFPARLAKEFRGGVF